MQYPAYSVKSANNEMVTTFMYNKLVGNIIITQIAGILANRIENNSEVNSEVSQGEKLGRIIMGSSVILYVEKVKVKIIVNNGDKVLSLQPILKLNG
jgi:phosphatidylserine decarboxylase